MKKSLFVSIVMLFVSITVNAQDYKNSHSSLKPTCLMPEFTSLPHPTQHLISLIMTSASIGGDAR